MLLYCKNPLFWELFQSRQMFPWVIIFYRSLKIHLNKHKIEIWESLQMFSPVADCFWNPLFLQDGQRIKFLMFVSKGRKNTQEWRDYMQLVK